MSDYSKNTNFTAKDTLASGTPAKKILGAELDAEFDEISTAISTKLDSIESLSTATPDFATDHLAIFDDSAVGNRKVLLNAISPSAATFILARGDSGALPSGDVGGTYAEVTGFAAASYDRGGCYTTGGRIAPSSAADDGLWVVLGRVTVQGATTIGRLAVTRFNSGGVAASRQIMEIDVPGSADTQMQVFGAHYLSYASGDYIALETSGTGTLIVVPPLTSHILVAWRAF